MRIKLDLPQHNALCVAHTTRRVDNNNNNVMRSKTAFFWWYRRATVRADSLTGFKRLLYGPGPA